MIYLDVFRSPTVLHHRNPLTNLTLLLVCHHHMTRRQTQGNTALMFAAKYGHIEVVKLLVDKGAQLDLKNNVRRRT